MNRRSTFNANASNNGAGLAGPAIAAGAPARAAIAALVERHGPMLHALALRLCGNRADAEDLVQDVFIQAFRKWHTFRGESDAGTWLYTIAARSCSARRRRKGGVDRRTPALSQLTPWGERTVTQIAAASEGDEDPAERAEAVERVRTASARLPGHLRMPLVLKFAAPRVGRAALHNVAGPEEDVPLLPRELLLANRQRLSVEVAQSRLARWRSAA